MRNGQLRRTCLVSVVFVGVALSFWGCRLPEMPSQDASGELRLELDLELEPPVTHVPLEYWRTHHREAVNRGEFPEDECQKCHDPDNYCNNCHSYVGVTLIERAVGI